MAYSQTRRQQTYDHRLRDLVRTTGDPDTLAELGVPRSTALGWLRRDHQPVVTTENFVLSDSVDVYWHPKLAFAG